MSSVRPRPDTHPTLYLVVVGGVALSEVRCVHEAVAASKTGVRVSSVDQCYHYFGNITG